MIFEEVFGVHISDFSTTEEIDRFIEERRGTKLEIRHFGSPLVKKGGSIFRIKKFGLEETLKNFEKLYQC